MFRSKDYIVFAGTSSLKLYNPTANVLTINALSSSWILPIVIGCVLTKNGEFVAK